METVLRKAQCGPVLPARAIGSVRTQVVPAAVQVKDAQASTSTRTQANPSEDIYIGFVKEEGFGDRTGRKGRVIKDDPRKYPSRDAFGTGGWAGGEAGLWKIREAAKADLQKKKAGTIKVGPSSPITTRAPPGKEVIYVGFGKDEVELRNAGAKGRVVVDDPRKYPGKEDIGWLSGIAGGFAGGEAGVKQYVATGTVKLRQPGEPGPRQFSPLTLAGLIALAGAAGGILLDLVGDALPAGETSGPVSSITGLLQAGRLDEQSKNLILIALAAIGTGGLAVATSQAIRTVQSAVASNAKNAAVTTAFLGVVVALAYGIITGE